MSPLNTAKLELRTTCRVKDSLELRTVCRVNTASRPIELRFTAFEASTSQDSNAENKMAVESPPKTRPIIKTGKDDPCAVRTQHAE